MVKNTKNIGSLISRDQIHTVRRVIAFQSLGFGVLGILLIFLFTENLWLGVIFDLKRNSLDLRPVLMNAIFIFGSTIVAFIFNLISNQIKKSIKNDFPNIAENLKVTREDRLAARLEAIGLFLIVATLLVGLFTLIFHLDQLNYILACSGVLSGVFLIISTLLRISICKS